jgi:PAS domain S-box-containing protein
MRKTRDQSADAFGLRKKAESPFAENGKSQDAGTGECKVHADLQRLAQELQIHQVELEAQNEELKNARNEAETERARYTDLYDFAPVGYFTLDDEGIIRQANLNGARLLGMECSRLMNTNFGLFLSETDRPIFNVFLGKVFANRVKDACDISLNKQGNELSYVHIEAIATANGRECRVAVSDITERKRAEDALKASEDLYHAIFEQAGDGVFILDTSGKIVSLNERFARLHGYTIEEMLNRGLAELDVEGTAPVPERIRRIMHGETLHFEVEHYHREGHTFPLSVTANLISVGGKQLILAVHRDITERKRIQEVLRDREERLKLAIGSGRIGIWDRDIESGTMIWNDTMFEIYGVSKECFTPSFDAWQSCLHPDDCDRVMEVNKAAIRGERDFDIEFRILRPDRAVRWIDADSKLIRNSDGKPIRIIGLNRDISKRKLAELKLQASLKEKETLLREIHHRVKNNLQVISSMLSMQARNVNNELVQNAFRESQNRVRAMADIHSMLYKSANFAEIDFGVYVQDMAKRLISSYGLKPGAVLTSISVENVSLSIETAIPCSLIINELLSNALKHAFPDGRKGEIQIKMHQVDSGLRIIFEDDGIGFPENIDFRNTSTLGLDLVNTLVEQLDGTIELLRDGGTKYLITLNREEPRKEYYNDRRSTADRRKSRST